MKTNLKMTQILNQLHPGDPLTISNGNGTFILAAGKDSFSVFEKTEDGLEFWAASHNGKNLLKMILESLL